MTLFSFQKLDPQLLLSLTVAQQKYWHENSRYRAGLNFSGGRDVRAGDTFHDVPIPRSERNWTKKVDILRKMARNDQGYPFWPCLAWVMIPLSYPHPLYRLSVRQRTIQQRQDIPYVFSLPRPQMCWQNVREAPLERWSSGCCSVINTGWEGPASSRGILTQLASFPTKAAVVQERLMGWLLLLISGSLG